MSIQPDLGVRHRPIELDCKIFAFSVRRQAKALAVPTGAERRQRAGVRVDLAVKGSFDRPIMRQSKYAPRGVVKLRSLCSLRFASVEPPSLIEALAPFVP